MERARHNLEALVQDFDQYVSRFERSRVFTGPGVCFHERAIARGGYMATGSAKIIGNAIICFAQARNLGRSLRDQSEP